MLIKAIMYSKIFNGENVSVDPSNITIGLSKYPTRNITAVHITPCPAPPSWPFFIRKIAMALTGLIILAAIFYGVLEGGAKYNSRLDWYERNVAEARTEYSIKSSKKDLRDFKASNSWMEHFIGQAVLVVLTGCGGLFFYGFIAFLIYIYRRPKVNALTFGNATDKPVLIVPAFTFGEYLKLILAEDPTLFKTKIQETCTPLIEFRDEIEKSINELQKT
jgi:hypothetical protein